MDALEFLRDRRRMCDSHRHCEGCPLEGGKCVVSSVAPDEDYKRIITAVEQWSKEHPRKTRQSVFLEKYPEARVCTEGVLNICPALISSAHRGDDGRCSEISKGCAACCREFWMKEVE